MTVFIRYYCYDIIVSIILKALHGYGKSMDNHIRENDIVYNVTKVTGEVS